MQYDFFSALLHIEDSTIFPRDVGKGTTKISPSVNFRFGLQDTNTASCDRGEGIKVSARGKLLALVHCGVHFCPVLVPSILRTSLPH